MHPPSLERWQHPHHFHEQSRQAEKRTTMVMWITVVMMLVEISTGLLYGSMALLADGWHMATHVAAFGIAVFAYRYARRHANNPRFTFGTGKVSVLGGFASAIALAVVALVMAFSSIVRMFDPQSIQFDEAILVAIIGLVVNLVCGWLLHERQQHHNHGHTHGHSHHHDHNLHAAYLHVLADALTSVFAIIALLFGKYFGWIWLDPVMGLVGAIIITRWSCSLLRDTSAILLDSAVPTQTYQAIKQAIEQNADNRISDLHVWIVGPEHYSAMLAIVTQQPHPVEYYKQLLQGIPHLSHVLIEVNDVSATPPPHL